MPDLTPDQLREHASEIILDHARDVEHLSISEHLEDLDLGDVAHESATEAIDALIGEAQIEVSWPGGQRVDVDVPGELRISGDLTAEQEIRARALDSSARLLAPVFVEMAISAKEAVEAWAEATDMARVYIETGVLPRMPDASPPAVPTATLADCPPGCSGKYPECKRA